MQRIFYQMTQEENDAILVANAKEDLHNFEELYQKYVKKIYRYFAARTSDVKIAEDLTSETFLKALEHFDSYEFQGKSFNAWIFRIAHNLLVDWYRKNEDKVESIDDDFEFPSNEEIPENMHFKLVVEKINELLGQFSDEEKEILVLKLTSGLKFSEIAIMLGKNENTVKSQYFRNLKSLKYDATKFVTLFITLFLLKP